MGLVEDQLGRPSVMRTDRQLSTGRCIGPELYGQADGAPRKYNNRVWLPPLKGDPK